jgi:hypothetical protein
MKKLILYTFFLGSIPLFSQDSISRKEIINALAILNKARKESGLNEVTLSPLRFLF